MTTNATSEAPLLPHEIARDDWVLVAPHPGSKVSWYRIVEILHHTSVGDTQLRVTSEDRGTRGGLIPASDVLYAMRSACRPTDPPAIDEQARRSLATAFPSVAFRVTRRKGGLTLSWTDGPAPQSVAECLADIVHHTSLRWRRQLSPEQRALLLLRDELSGSHTLFRSTSDLWAHRTLVENPDPAESVMARTLLTLAVAHRRTMEEQLDQIGIDVLRAIAMPVADARL